MASVTSATPIRKPRILLAACGTVCAINFARLCNAVNKWGEVKAVATPASLGFIHRVAISRDVAFYTDEDEWSTWRTYDDSVLDTELVEWADIMAIARLSSNTLAEIAGGLSDNLLTRIVRAWDYEKKPMFVAPSMSRFMWNNPFTEQHLVVAEKLGVRHIANVDTANLMADISYIDGRLRSFWEHRGEQLIAGNAL